MPDHQTYVAPLLMTHRAEEGLSIQIKRLTPRHYALMDHILAHPTTSFADIARHFGVTQAWLSTVYHSDLFQAVLNQRRTHLSEIHDNSVVAKLRNIADKSLDKITSALDDEETPLSHTIEITKLSLKALGHIDQKNTPSTSVTINNNPTVFEDRPELNDAVQAARLRILARKSSQTPVQIETTYEEK